MPKALIGRVTFRCGAYLVEVVVEVDVSRTQVSAEQRRVRREDGGDIYVLRPTDRQADSRQPLVEVSDDVRLPRQRFSELNGAHKRRTVPSLRITFLDNYLAE